MKSLHTPKMILILFMATILFWVLVAHREALSDSSFLLNPLIKTYRAYFMAIDAGAEMRRLPYEVKQKLNPYYVSGLLDKVWYGESRHLVIKDTAMTDCSRIYFPSSSGMIGIIENGKLFEKKYRDDLQWLLHELTHSEQCEAQGGRDEYAVMWFGELAATTITQLILDHKNVNDRMLHDAMPMEKDADQKAFSVLARIYPNAK